MIIQDCCKNIQKQIDQLNMKFSNNIQCELLLVIFHVIPQSHDYLKRLRKSCVEQAISNYGGKVKGGGHFIFTFLL